MLYNNSKIYKIYDFVADFFHNYRGYYNSFSYPFKIEIFTKNNGYKIKIQEFQKFPKTHKTRLQKKNRWNSKKEIN